MALPQITWQDVQQMPDDGNRYEAIEGELYMTPAPTVRHQRISIRLEMALHDLLVDPGHGELLHAPVGVEFPATGEGVQPDILFVSHGRRGIVAEDWLRGAPDLVVEILSPSTAHRDRGVKLRLYERQGVAEYWVVDPEAEAVEVWRFDAEPRHRRLTDAVEIRLGDEVLGRIDLGPIFLRSQDPGSARG
jgi:Uma2 family endonuclease